MEAPTTKPEGPGRELMLHEAASKALEEAGHSNPDFWRIFLEPDAKREDVLLDIQRFLINRAFEMSFGCFDPKTRFSEKIAADYMNDQFDARYCLLPTGDYKTWLHSFKQKVVPFVMKYRLGMEVQAAQYA